MTAQITTQDKSRAERAYLENRVRGANPQELLVILYEGLLKSVLGGKRALEGNVYDEAHAELSRARRIVTYLTNSLQEEGGEITVNLRQLYGFCFENIGRANLEKKPELLDGVVNVVKELTGAWTDLARMQKQGGLESAQQTKESTE
jgi:flagellar secretion chaperone FliS